VWSKPGVRDLSPLSLCAFLAFSERGKPLGMNPKGINFIPHRRPYLVANTSAPGQRVNRTFSPREHRERLHSVCEPAVRCDFPAPPPCWRRCKGRSTSRFTRLDVVSTQRKRLIGRDAVANSPRMDRREPPEISERLQFLGWRVVRSGDSGGPSRSVKLASFDEEAIKYADERRINQNQ